MTEPTEPIPGTPEYWARTTPEAVAVVDATTVLSYAEWDDRANRLASALAEAGFGPGDRVAVRSRIRHEWFVVNRALGKLGCEQVALNWRLTPPEARYIIEDSGARAVVYDDPDPAPLALDWADLGLVLVTIGEAPVGLPVKSYRELIEAGKPEARFSGPGVSLILYTSGTTGNPKGVLGSDRVGSPEAMLAYMRSVGSVPPTPMGTRSLLTMPLHHGAGPGVAAGAHGGGGAVFALDPFDAEGALRLIAEHRITHWTGVPTFMHRIHALPEEVRARYDVSSIRALTVGAAPVPQSLKQWIVDYFGPDVLWEGYGASEVGMVSYMPPADQTRKPGSSGLPYDGVRIRIVDEEWRDLPVGAEGEIAAQTPAVIARYLNREDLGPDVLDADGFFRTGDVGRVDEDGYLYITDRKKDMIVAGGSNIYPAEIEAVLVQHPDVVDAAVIGIPHDDFGEQPMAFVELRPGASLTAEALIAFTADRLAPYKRPRRIEFVPELPRNPTGKVMKGELRAPFWQGRERKV